jgi:hypothetical protein
MTSADAGPASSNPWMCLELGDEPVLLELQHSLELLIAKASRLEASLLARG